MSNPGHRAAKTFTGLPCKRCRGTLRYASTRNCVPCHKAQTALKRGKTSAPIDDGADLIGDIA